MICLPVGQIEFAEESREVEIAVVAIRQQPEPVGIEFEEPVERIPKSYAGMHFLSMELF